MNSVILSLNNVFFSCLVSLQNPRGGPWGDRMCPYKAWRGVWGTIDQLFTFTALSLYRSSCCFQTFLQTDAGAKVGKQEVDKKKLTGLKSSCFSSFLTFKGAWSVTAVQQLVELKVVLLSITGPAHNNYLNMTQNGRPVAVKCKLLAVLHQIFCRVSYMPKLFFVFCDGQFLHTIPEHAVIDLDTRLLYTE